MCSWHIMTPSKAFLWDKSHHLRHIFVVTCVIMHHTFYLDDFILFLNNHNWHIFSSNGLFWWWVMKDLDLQLLQWVKILKISFGLVEKYWFDVFGNYGWNPWHHQWMMASFENNVNESKKIVPRQNGETLLHPKN